MFKERSLPFDYAGDPAYYSSFNYLGSTENADAQGLSTMEGTMAARIKGYELANVLAFTDRLASRVGYESISYTQRKRPTINDCVHKTNGGVSYPFTVCYSAAQNGPVDEQLYLAKLYRYRPAIRYATYEADSLNSHFPVDLSTARRTAWGVMQPRFEGEVSMLNFIIELKDFKSLARFLCNKPLRKLSNMFRKFFKNKRYDLTKPAAELHLANEFALKPLLSDIASIVNQMTGMIQEVQTQFMEDGLSTNTRHYTELFNISSVTPFGPTWNPQLHVGESEQLTFNASLEYTYKYNMRSTIDAFCKYWGLKPDAEKIWNAIPLSFLVDYVLKVGNALAINSRDKNVILNISQYCESLLSERTSGWHYNNSHLYGPILGVGSNPFPPKNGKTLVYGIRSTLFTRYRTSPTTWTVMPRLAKPSTKQGWNCLALARAFF